MTQNIQLIDIWSDKAGKLAGATGMNESFIRATMMGEGQITDLLRRTTFARNAERRLAAPAAALGAISLAAAYMGPDSMKAPAALLFVLAGIVAWCAKSQANSIRRDVITEIEAAHKSEQKIAALLQRTSAPKA